MDEALYNQMLDQLYRLLATAEGPDQIRDLLCDICTPKEVGYMAQRLECARLLMAGETYETVIAATEISSATLSRVSRCVHAGTGGYNTIFRAFLAAEDNK